MDFEINWNSDELFDDLKKAGQEAVNEAAEIVLQDCKPPVRTGRLAGSGHVEEWPAAAHGTVGASVVFDAPHSHLVHELPDGHQLKNGEEKWLEKASDRNRDEVLRLYEAKLGGVLNDGR